MAEIVIFTAWLERRCHAILRKLLSGLMLLDRPSGSGRPSSGKFYDSAGVKRPLHVGQAAYQFAFFFRLSKSSGWYDFSNVLFADGVLNKFGLWKAGTAVKVIGGNGVYWNAEGGQIQT